MPFVIDIRRRDAIIFEVMDGDVISEYDGVDKYDTLVYPSDCKSKTLRMEADQCKLKVNKKHCAM